MDSSVGGQGGIDGESAIEGAPLSDRVTLRLVGSEPGIIGPAVSRGAVAALAFGAAVALAALVFSPWFLIAALLIPLVYSAPVRALRRHESIALIVVSPRVVLISRPRSTSGPNVEEIPGESITTVRLDPQIHQPWIATNVHRMTIVARARTDVTLEVFGASTAKVRDGLVHAGYDVSVPAGTALRHDEARRADHDPAWLAKSALVGVLYVFAAILTVSAVAMGTSEGMTGVVGAVVVIGLLVGAAEFLRRALFGS